MPTMSKLFSALLMGGLGYLAASAIAGHLPEEEPEGMLRYVVAAFGLLVGWRFMGPRMGSEWNAAVGMGLSSSVALVIVSAFWFAGVEMIHRAMRMSYGGDPFAAVQDMFLIAVEQSEHWIYVDVISILVVGGILAGLIAETIARRWS